MTLAKWHFMFIFFVESNLQMKCASRARVSAKAKKKMLSRVAPFEKFNNDWVKNVKIVEKCMAILYHKSSN